MSSSCVYCKSIFGFFHYRKTPCHQLPTSILHRETTQTYSLAQGLAGFSLQVLFHNISQVFCVFTSGWNNNAKPSLQSVLTLTQSPLVMADSPPTHLSTTALSCTYQKWQLLCVYSLWITTASVCAVQMTGLIVSSTLLHDQTRFLSPILLLFLWLFGFYLWYINCQYLCLLTASLNILKTKSTCNVITFLNATVKS